LGRVLDIKPEQGDSVTAPLLVVIAHGECCMLAPFKMEQLSPPCRVSGVGEIAMTRDRLTSETSMPSVKLRASVILGAFEEAQSELVGKAVVLTDGKAGTVESVWLDELHGLRISIGGHDGKWPISTIKFAEKN
jgi:hypothetical protein